MQKDIIKPIRKDFIDPDHELLLWEKWIKIREEEVTHLSQKLKRSPADLTMNLIENVREEKEWKIVLEYAQIDKKPSVRGHLWEQPERLKQSCYCQPAYEIQRTRTEMGRPCKIEHIGVPKYIQENEKGIFGISERRHCKKLDHSFESYREKRGKDLKAKLDKIDPFKPDITNLIVKGNKPRPAPKKMAMLPNITITSADISDEVLCSIYAVRINSTIFIKNVPNQCLNNLENLKKENWHEDCSSWLYYFKTNVGKVGRSQLFLHNLGTITLRYCWKTIIKPILYIPDDTYQQVFFFNKNEDVLFPGQCKEIFFTFVSDRPGIYNESLELNFCNVHFFDNISDKLIINLTADAFEDMEKNNRKINSLRNIIKRKAIKNIVRSLIEEAIDKATAIQPQIYPYKKFFLEAELFVMKNPVCFYHQTEVMKMKELYSEMTSGQLWDLSISSWRSIMLQKDYEERTEYYDQLKKSHAELLKPWYEGESLLNQKYSTMKLLLGQLADKFDEEYERIPEMLEFLDKTDRDPNASRTMSKYFILEDPCKTKILRDVFYIRMYEHVAATIELCAGILSSLDLNRWIEFDFCQG